MRKRFTGRLGFTLIELLVVVLIIGILVAVAVPQYQKAIKKTRYAKMRTFATSLVKASQVTYLRTGNFPTTFDELDITVPGDMAIVRTTSSASNAAKYCAQGKKFYCCLTFPAPNYAGAGVECAFNDLSIAFIQRYTTSSGTSTNRSICVQKRETETFCQQLPGATKINGVGLLTPTGYVGVYTYYRID
ncbi:MAG: prepilin-type N-terminal cleavage/methylation domain-containing protein [Elusimicrobiaceae bacterium]|nr:prepilin-type N-terminal cleavage/methylation domain-containing protein [Elusimicrobiaceae bacterium]